MVFHSKYRYVTRRAHGNNSRKKPGWYAQNPRARLWLGPYEDEEQAAAAAAKSMKVKVASLLRSQVPMLRGPEVKEDAAVSTYRYVTKRAQRGHTYWIGQPSRNRQKLFKDIKQAAAWTAKVRKTTLKQ